MTINGLELKTPSECGKQNVLKNGSAVHTVLLQDGEPYWCFNNDSTYWAAGQLLDLPKPPVTRPYRREEVQWEWRFRHKKNGNDYAIVQVTDIDVMFYGWAVSYKFLLENFDRLTTERDASGNSCWCRRAWLNSETET